MALTDKKIKDAKAKSNKYTLSDGGGLELLIRPTGTKTFVFRYRFGGRTKNITIGQYPDIPLKAKKIEEQVIKGVREIVQDYKSLIAQGVDPSSLKKAEKFKNQFGKTFGEVALAWNRKRQKEDLAEITRKNSESRLEMYVLPYWRNSVMEQIKTIDVMQLLKKIENKGTYDTLRRVKTILGQVWKFAISNGIVENNPVANVDNSAFVKAPKKHFNAISDKDELWPVLDKFNEYENSRVVKIALLITPMIFVRPGELRQMKWVDIDFNQRRWCYHISKTKTDHIVPLSSQVICLLKALKLLTDNSIYCFPNRNNINKTMSENALNKARNSLGYSKEDFHFHGFRATARTLLVEELEYPEDIIELQLGHNVIDPNGRAYNRVTKIKKRFQMMQDWSNFLEKGMKTKLLINEEAERLRKLQEDYPLFFEGIKEDESLSKFYPESLNVLDKVKGIVREF